MSSIEEKLNTLHEIIKRLQEFKVHIKQDQSSIASQLAESKSKWDDPQMERFSGNSYVGGFINSLAIISGQVDRAISFIEHKYSTLETHRN